LNACKRENPITKEEKVKKVDVTICTGANCNKAQATWLKQFDQILSPALKSRIHVSCGNCERRCTSDIANAPRVRVNDRVFTRATPAQVREAVIAQERTLTPAA
jgi:NADH:ubiquinone oxidoreductase subunit E